MNDQTTVQNIKPAARFDIDQIRADFPVLSQQVYGKPLVFLDSGASAQKPRAVIDLMTYVMEEEYANVHRGVHYMSQHTTARYEAVRGKIARFLNAGQEDEIIFTSGGTESINLVAASWGRKNLKAGDEVIVSVMEHHSNIVPWQMLRDELGIVLQVAPIDDDGNFLIDEFAALLSERTKLVAITHISNVLGTVVPIKQVAALAHDNGALILVDGCQGAPHMPVDVRDLDVDFYAFTGHKLYGPTGIGALYGKMEHLRAMPPYQGGGDMIKTVSFEKTVYQDPPHRFEAGTPPIIEAIGLGAAIDYVNDLGFEAIMAHKEAVVRYAQERLMQLPGVTVYGKAPDKIGIVSFLVDGIHAHDVGTIVDHMGVAIRVGHHCAEPLMQRFDVEAMARASFALYNSREDVDVLVQSVQAAQEFFG